MADNKPPVDDGLVERDIAGETVLGFRVAAWRETHPEHGNKFGYKYSEHWSTPTKHPNVQIERLFTEDQLRAALANSDTITRLRAAIASSDENVGRLTVVAQKEMTSSIGDDVRIVRALLVAIREKADGQK